MNWIQKVKHHFPSFRRSVVHLQLVGSILLLQFIIQDIGGQTQKSSMAVECAAVIKAQLDIRCLTPLALPVKRKALESNRQRCLFFIFILWFLQKRMELSKKSCPMRPYNSLHDEESV